MGIDGRVVDAIETARAILPWWVRSGDLLVWVPAAFVSGLAFALFVTAIAGAAWRKAGLDAPWTERARLATPIRRVQIQSIIIATVVFVVIVSPAFSSSSPMHATPPTLLELATGATAFAVTIWVRARTEGRLLGTPLSFMIVLRDVASRALTMFPHAFILVCEWVLLPDDFGARMWLVLGGASLAFVAVLMGGGLFVARALGLARSGSPRTREIVRIAVESVRATPSTRAGTRRASFDLRAKVFEVPWIRANAFVYPLARVVTFTDGALRHLSDDELGAIAKHEIGHLTESRWALFGRASAGLTLIAVPPAQRLLARYLDDGDSPFGSLLATVLVLFAWMLLVVLGIRRLAHRLEKRADAIAHHEEHERGAYARALERIYAANLMPAVTGAKRPIHPDLYDRLTAAGAPPAYPRPAPPPRAAATTALLLGVLLLAIGASTPAIARSLLRARAAGMVSESSRLMSLAVSGDPWDAGELARVRSRQGDDESAAILYAACEAAEPASVYYPVNHAIVLVRLGRCAAAHAPLGVARALTSGDETTRPEEAALLENATSIVRACHEGERANAEAPE